MRVVVLAEAEIADRAERIGPEPLAPFGLFADRDAEFGASVIKIDAMQSRRPDRSSIRQQTDDEVVVGPAWRGEHAIEPGGLTRGAHRRVHGEITQHLGIIEPAYEERKVGAAPTDVGTRGRP